MATRRRGTASTRSRGEQLPTRAPVSPARLAGCRQPPACLHAQGRGETVVLCIWCDRLADALPDGAHAHWNGVTVPGRGRA